LTVDRDDEDAVDSEGIAVIDEEGDVEEDGMVTSISIRWSS
jgi:hypothetical protein